MTGTTQFRAAIRSGANKVQTLVAQDYALGYDVERGYRLGEMGSLAPIEAMGLSWVIFADHFYTEPDNETNSMYLMASGVHPNSGWETCHVVGPGVNTTINRTNCTFSNDTNTLWVYVQSISLQSDQTYTLTWA